MYKIVSDVKEVPQPMQDTLIPRQHEETSVLMAGSQSQKGSLVSTDSCTMTQSSKGARARLKPSLFMYGGPGAIIIINKTRLPPDHENQYGKTQIIILEVTTRRGATPATTMYPQFNHQGEVTLKVRQIFFFF